MSKKWIGGDAAGAGDWSIAANWSPSGVPTNDDTVVIADTSQSITAGLDQSSLQLDKIFIDKSFEGEIGDADNYLQVGAYEVTIGNNASFASYNGSPRIKLHLANASPVVVVNDSATAGIDGLPPVILLAGAGTTSAGMELKINRGRVGVAVSPLESCNIESISVGYVTSRTGDAEVSLGEGVNVGTLYKTGGQVILAGDVATIDSRGGTLTIVGGDITSLSVADSDVICNTTSTVAAITVYDDGTVDMLRSMAGRTVTSVTLSGGTIKYDPAVVTVGDVSVASQPVELRARSI